MKKRSMLAYASLAVGFAASLAAPSAAHAATSVGDGTSPNLAGNNPIVDSLLGNHHGPAVAAPTSATEGSLLGQ
ncbi:hypothetical protein OG455_22595 [Kitasatospora sp. NBC_01287]|uniref:hypothetical protein n=1 Tax=Kitasatospora sp. NBC_01287 TaxID=2903573 RepID=UPI0022553DC0|nr:hypothetical protein [Kitasatospora sp. NBC_01287]MCX4748268.1 hypothetical protein [Kitasatospora sp. NBC_01287]